MILNRGLLSKAVYETRGSVIGFGLGLAIAMGALTAVLPQFQDNLNHLLESMPFMRTILTSMLGMNIENEITGQMLQTFVWVHPVILSLVWAAAIVWCTRVPVGEIDRGTIDVLLGWPVSRWMITCSETCVIMINGLVIILFGTAGHLVVTYFMTQQNDPPGLLITLRIIINLYVLYLAVGGIAWCCSCTMERRGRAMGVSFAIVMLSFLLNFLAQFWPLAQPFAWLSVLKYYQPAQVVRDELWPIQNILILSAVAIGSWLVGAIIFSRRAIHTT